MRQRQQKTDNLVVRMTPEQFAMIESAASERGETVSEYARRILFAVARPTADQTQGES